MRELFIEKEMEINALPSIVWDVLTKREYSDAWSVEFSGDEDFLYIESDWKLHHPVYWNKEPEETLLEGTVTAIEPNRLLRFTVLEKRHSEHKAVLREDEGVTFEITQINGHCILHLRHGDFGKVAAGEAYMEKIGTAWDRALVKIKNLAEHKLVVYPAAN